MNLMIILVVKYIPSYYLIITADVRIVMNVMVVNVYRLIQLQEGKFF